MHVHLYMYDVCVFMHEYAAVALYCTSYMHTINFSSPHVIATVLYGCIVQAILFHSMHICRRCILS